MARRKNDATPTFSVKYCSKTYWKSIPQIWFPILRWLPFYTLEDFKGDLIAGLSVGLTTVPQGLALAQLAGLPPQYGLYTAFMGSFMYSIFGTCKDVVIGPTSVMALMTAEHVVTGGPAYAVMLTFLSGCFQLIFGFLNLGFLVNYISASVLSGFTTAAAIIIATSQLKGFLGLRFQSRGFIQNIYKTFVHIPEANLYDLAMGSAAVIFLLLLKQYKDLKCTSCVRASSRCQQVLETVWWGFATARNLTIVILCSTIAAACLCLKEDVFTLTQHVEAGLPPFSIPPFSISFLDVDQNITINRDMGYILKDLGTGVIIVPFLSLLEAIAIAKVFSKSKSLDATREMIALGMGNMLGSFVSAYPATASFSRTVINNTTGVRTPLGGIFSGILVLLALGILAPTFHYIPRACLSAIIFSAVIFLIHLEDIPAMWRMSRTDLVPFCVTFTLSLTMGLEYGLLFGVAISLAMLLYKQNNPPIKLALQEVQDKLIHVTVTPEECIFFPSIDFLKGEIHRAVQSVHKDEEYKIIIAGDNLTNTDYATAMGLESLAESFAKDNVEFEIHISKPKVMEALRGLEKYVKYEEVQPCLYEMKLEMQKDGIRRISPPNDIHESDSTTALLARNSSIDGEPNVVVVVSSKKDDVS